MMSAVLKKDEMSDEELVDLLSGADEETAYDSEIRCHQCGVPVPVPQVFLDLAEAAWGHVECPPGDENATLRHLQKALERLGRKR